MPLRLLPLLAALVLVPAVPASAEPAGDARPLTGAVVGAPEARGARVLVPVLLDRAAARRAGLATPVVRVSVPAEGGVRGLHGPLPAARLRLGDHVAALPLALPRDRGKAVRPRLRADALRVRDRATIASFAALEAAVAETRGALRRTAERLAAASPPPGATPVRHDLGLLREHLHLLEADLRRLTGALDGAAHRLARRPVPARDPGGRHAGERRALREALARARAATEEAADALAAGVAAVDAVLPGLDAGALAVPALAAAGLHAALERAQARLAGLAPPRIGRA